MSLSTIAQALKDIDSGTPRRLVDQLLLAKKQKKKPEAVQAHNLTSDTYTLALPNVRNSLPVCPSVDGTKMAKNEIFQARNSKLSLDSKSLGQTFALKYNHASRTSGALDEFGDTLDYEAENTLAEMLSAKFPSKDFTIPKISSPRPEKIGTA